MKKVIGSYSGVKTGEIIYKFNKCYFISLIELKKSLADSNNKIYFYRNDNGIKFIFILNKIIYGYTFKNYLYEK